jgi:hypothetical protein
VLTLQVELRKDITFKFPWKNSKVLLHRKCGREKPSYQVEVVTQFVGNNSSLGVDVSLV